MDYEKYLEIFVKAGLQGDNLLQAMAAVKEQQQNISAPAPATKVASPLTTAPSEPPEAVSVPEQQSSSTDFPAAWGAVLAGFTASVDKLNAAVEKMANPGYVPQSQDDIVTEAIGNILLGDGRYNTEWQQ